MMPPEHPSVDDERQRLQAAVQALEAQRALLGDAVVETALAPLRAQLASLEMPPPAAPRSVRRQATILFADVSGFTAMSARLDPEEVTERINALWRRIDRAILDHGGVIDKHIGDAVMAVWGRQTARENDPERAIRAALAMQQALADFSAGLPAAPLTMRVGLHTGTVVANQIETTSEATVIGDAVNVASRLEGAAPVGGILISHAVYRHVRGVFDVQPQPPLHVKGRTEPITTYVVQRAKPRPFRVPTRGVEGVETRMIGREVELAALQAAYQHAMQDSQTQVVLLVAEAGVGKSRLLYEFENWLELQPQAITYFRARAVPETASTPYSLWRDLFRLTFSIADSDPAAAVLDKFRSGMTPFLPPERADLVGHLVGFDLSSSPAVAALLGSPNFARLASADLTQYFRAVTTDEVVAARPTVLLLEDLHWSDDTSLDLLEHLVSTLPTARLMIVCPARPALMEHRPTFGMDAAYTRLDLPALSPEQGAALVTEILQKAERVPDDLRALIVRGAEGNPYYVEELIKMLIDDGVITIAQDDAPWRIDTARLGALRVPDTLTGVLQARLDSLPTDERELLQRAAVVGRQFWDQAVAALRASDDRALDVGGGLAASMRRELIHSRDRSAFASAQEYLFRHALLRDVTYETVLLRLRRVYHGQVAGWLEANAGERLGEYLTLIARHYELAADPAQAAVYLRRAGDEAYKISAYRDALSAYEHALRLTPDHDLFQRATLSYHAGKSAERLSQFTLAAGHLAQALQWARAAGTGEARALEMLIYNALGLVSLRQGQIAEATAMAQEAMMLAREMGDQTALAGALTLLGAEHGARGLLRESVAYNSEALAIHRALNDRQGILINLNNLGGMSAMLGDYEAARRYTEECYQLCSEIGDRYMTANTLGNLSMMLYERGETTEATAYAEQSLAIRREINDRYGMAISLSGLGLIAYSLSAYDDSQTYYEESLRLRREINDRLGVARVLGNLGTLTLERGQLDDAQRYFHESYLLARDSRDQRLMANALNNLAELALRHGSYAEAQRWLAEGLAASRAIKAPPLVLHALGIYAHLLSDTGRLTEACHLFGLVLHHPGALSETRKKYIEPELATLRQQHPAVDIDAALAYGATLDYERTVEAALAALNPPPAPG